MTRLRRIRVFVASPGDVQSERAQLAKVVDEINLTLAAIAPEKNVFVELVRWETHVAPGLGNPQEVVNRQIPPYDIFVGIMWRRFGTPTPVAGSGTAEEFHHAYTRWQSNRSFAVLFYFCQKPFPPPRTSEDVKQLGKVVAFHEELEKKALISEYEGPETFAEIVRPHLLRVLGQITTGTRSPAQAAERSRALSSPRLERTGKSVSELAEDYERLREAMPFGDARTRAMSAVFSRMRSIALSAYPLLDELTSSRSEGRRLVAIAILREIPTPSYLQWLAERPTSEPHFPGYHAVLALQSAARALKGHARAAVGSAVARAEELLETVADKDPNQVLVLEETKLMLATPKRKTPARRRRSSG